METIYKIKNSVFIKFKILKEFQFGRVVEMEINKLFIKEH